MKADRRTVLKLGIAAGTLPLTAAASHPIIPDTASREESLQIYKVIYDEGFDQGREFGRLSRQLGANVEAIRNDVTDIWYNDLYYRWKKGPASIAGLTSDTSLFCLEQLARDVKMHVVYRADHSAADGQRSIARTAQRLANYPRGGLAHRAPAAPGLPGQGEARQVSWIIAPLT